MGQVEQDLTFVVFDAGERETDGQRSSTLSHDHLVTNDYCLASRGCCYGCPRFGMGLFKTCYQYHHRGRPLPELGYLEHG